MSFLPTTARTSSGMEDNVRMTGKPTTGAVAESGGVVTRRRALGDIGTNVTAAGAPAVAKPAVAKPGTARAEAEEAMFDLTAHGIKDIDAADMHDPHQFGAYAPQIYGYFKAMEVQRNAAFGYMATQGDINEKMRAILIDWLNEVHFKFKLMPETLYLTVNLIDRYLERKPVIRQKLQLVGVTAMLLASKYEEIFAPEVRDFVYITDKAYTREQILEMEAWMLRVLEFRISVPTPYVFLNRFLKAAEADARVTLFATYLVERSLQEYKMLAHTPSKLAATAVNIALRTLKGRAAWNNTLTFFSGYTEDELRGSVQDVQDIIALGAASSLQAVRKKYLLPKFGEVANIALVPLE